MQRTPRFLSLSARLTLTLSVSAVVLAAVAGAGLVSAEEAELRRSLERELRLLGRSLAVAFENALRDGQPEDVEETLRELERIDPAVDIYVYDGRGELVAISTGAPSRAHVESWQQRSATLRFREDSGPRVAELVVPLHVHDGAPSSLLVVQPLAPLQADLAATRRTILIFIVALALVLVAVTWVASHAWVRAPLARMIQEMRRVREGDLTEPKGLPASRSEVGEAMREFRDLVVSLREARVRLETETEQRRQLERGLREVDKLATVGQLAAGLAHEIGSPLQILDGRIAKLERAVDSPEETRRLAGILREQTGRITRIVARLLDVARRRPVAKAAIDPAPPVRAVVDLLEAETRRRGLSLELRVQSGLPQVWADSDLLQQLTLNLIRNGLDATPAGGRIGVRLEEAAGAEGGVQLVVRDTGRGMDPETRERAFEPFFTAGTPGGSGLGLTVVRGLVDELGGDVVVHSSPGEGTTFVVTLSSGAGAMEAGPHDDR